MSFSSLSCISISKGVVASPICDKGWRDYRRGLEELCAANWFHEEIISDNSTTLWREFPGITAASPQPALMQVSTQETLCDVFE